MFSLFFVTDILVAMTNKHGDKGTHFYIANSSNTQSKHKECKQHNAESQYIHT